MNFIKKIGAGLLALLSVSVPAKDQPKETNNKTQYEIKEEINNNYEKAYVDRVVDGDTAEVTINGNQYKLRFIGVDTPETVHPSKPVEYFGKEASDFTKEKLEDKEIYLEKDVSDTDRYGRKLRYIWLEKPDDKENPTFEEIKEKNFNAILLDQGYGKLSTFPPDVKYVEEFKEIEKEARKNKKGLWSENEEKSIKQEKIKGNKNSKIYHTPDGKYYDKISEKNTIYFNSEKEAIENGYRKSKE